MNIPIRWILTTVLAYTAYPSIAQTIVYETTSPYHHIKVVDKNGMRILHFDNTTQSRISLRDPVQGHFEYTEYFHMPWLWNDQIKTVLMIGLGGGCIQRAYQAYYPKVTTETIEMDPKVLEVARTYFQFNETEQMKVFIGDGRIFLRRAQKKFDVIILDAYTANRYGSYIPYQLITQEFFMLTQQHLTEHGVLAYNVIGKINAKRKNIIGSIYNTLKTCFKQVYMFPAVTSNNVVFIATKNPEPITLPLLRKKMDTLIESKRISFPRFLSRLRQFKMNPPAGAAVSDIFTDDFAPVDGLLKTE